MTDVLIEAKNVHSEADLHRIHERHLELGEHYGRNLAALRDRLLADVPRPVRLVWRDSELSRQRLGDELFGQITALFDEVAQQDIDFYCSRGVRQFR